MKRILKISFDLALLSFIPILSWFCLSLILDRNLINIFTLTYPIQFIWCILKSIFSTGANISKYKDQNENAVMSAIFLGTIISIIIFGTLAIKIEDYINFMNMDVSIYKTFAIYSVLQLCIQLIFTFFLQKLYYEEKNTLANKYSLSFNLLSFIVLIVSSLIFKEQFTIVLITLTSLGIYTIYLAIKTFDKFKLKLNILNCIKYDSVDLFTNVAFFFISLFGLSNAIDYGIQYALAITFVSLITDTQWDVYEAISIVSKIDILKNDFNYIKHRNNAYKLFLILILSTLLLLISLFKFYELDLILVLIYLSVHIIGQALYPIHRLKTCYLQLEYSASKITFNKTIANILRFLLSLLPTPFCTGIGQFASSLHQFFSTNIIWHRNYKIDKNGYVIKK